MLAFLMHIDHISPTAKVVGTKCLLTTRAKRAFVPIAINTIQHVASIRDMLIQ